MKRSTNVIVSNLSRGDILFSTFYTGLFLLFRKKTGGRGTGPPAPPLATALSDQGIETPINIKERRLEVEESATCSSSAA